VTDLVRPAAAAGPCDGAPARATLAATTASLNAWIEVDLRAIEHNVQAVRKAVGKGVEIIAVVKANGYGAGMAGIGPVLEAAGVERFAVVWFSEARALRAAGVARPIIVLGHAFASDAPAAVAAGVTLTCESSELGRALSAAAVELGRAAAVHIHVDSGLHRDGLSPAQAVELANALRGLAGVEVEGLSTHMANADEADDSFSDSQQEAFAAVVRELDWIPYRHTANSATALRRPLARYHGVRIGLALHGILPENTPALDVRPVLSLKARLARVFEVGEGEGVSYGLTWRAPRPSRMGLVPVGYADGWRRNLGNEGEVLAGGRRVPMRGRVCMDQFLIDLTDVDGPFVAGDEVVLLGEQGPERITASEVAARAGTIPWDVLASLQARLPRVYHRGDVVERVD